MDALYTKQLSGKIQCILCPHMCILSEGHAGICKVRRNSEGKIVADTWGKVAALHFDPIEKKPLYHFFPGTTILSIGSVGCNMRCQCCQNWQISQVSASGYQFDRQYSPADILHTALSRSENLGVAYTYNEPGIWFEFMIDTARLVQANQLKNVMVSNGYLNEDPLKDLLKVIDAFNIDLKGFSEEFYRKFTGAALEPVLRSLRQIRNGGKHLEVTCLIIPGQNDDPVEFNQMTDWIVAELGNETVLHLSAYHPAYKTRIGATSAADMEKLLEIAQKKLLYVYSGNIHIKDFQDTRCSKCGSIVIKRSGYHIDKYSLTKNGLCLQCGNQVIIS